VKALVFTGPGVLELQDVAEPEVAEGDVLVQASASRR
jgi:NADPH:quinone reductase-like Zn-dependent oxidoreductase